MSLFNRKNTKEEREKDGNAQIGKEYMYLRNIEVPKHTNDKYADASNRIKRTVRTPHKNEYEVREIVK